MSFVTSPMGPRAFSIVALIAVGTGWACGGSHETMPESRGGAGGGVAGRSAAAGRTAAGRSASAGEQAVEGPGEARAGSSAPVAPPVACGTSACLAPPNTLSALLGGLLPPPVACCLDEAQGSCGVAPNITSICQVPATPDERCPGIDVSAFAAATGVSGTDMVAGCCIEGSCGVDGALFGQGCVENSEAKTMLSTIPLIGMLAEVPLPRACL